ncbi:hypothetical protein GCM10010339_61180 [Streptomyces alanosinicus]|uniref:DUF8017 domain-containing protein n=1 Tax=Streptomyces alanosinicus TaxID=68171 RepID=A0A919D6P1_9ACTN|nr:hypothetical protein GCM10010339_61180 [Streptomyces alanosinicus]
MPNPQNNPQQPPQDNPYQQPGYQQPNPYQQPGYQQYPQAGPYGQQQQWGQQQPPTVPVPQPPQGGGRAKLIAIVAAAAVVVAAGVTGYLVLGKKDDKNDQAGGKGGQHASQSPTSPPSPSASVTDDPRGTQTEKPTIPGWKVVVNPRWGVAYDVPADWEIQSPGLDIGFDLPKKKNGQMDNIIQSGTAKDQPKWCSSDDDKDGHTDDTPLAVVGSKGASGAKSTDEIAVNTPAWWVYGGYTQPDKKSISFDKKGTPFVTASGIKGSYGWARSSHTPRKGKCASDGKALTFGFQNSVNDYVSFNFYGAKGVKDEVPEATIMKILSSVRLHGDPTNQ